MLGKTENYAVPVMQLVEIDDLSLFFLSFFSNGRILDHLNSAMEI